MSKHNILLDTHVWIWFVNGEENISESVRTRINLAIRSHKAYVSAISCWEVAMLSAKKRLIFNMPCLEWVEKALKNAGIQLAPITPAVAVDSSQLPSEFHGDPADRLIVSTARVENMELLTRDKSILGYAKKKHVTAFKV